MSDWQPDTQLEGFESCELAFVDDYDGPVVATLVRLPGTVAPRGAVLYVHGFIDYFFQRHMAERFAAEGYAFYAVDLRKHGRSLRAHQHPCFCANLDEHYADLTRAIALIEAERPSAPLLLAGHSTGGLLCALYANEGEQRGRIGRLWLNSPFFEFNAPPGRRAALSIGIALGRWMPFLNDRNALSSAYGESLHRDHKGEWSYDTRLKPINGFPAYYGWLGAVHDAHAKVQAGLAIECPVLVMHSDAADIVLDYRDISRFAPGLGRNVSVMAIPGGLHDLVLSRSEIREEVFRALFAWAAPPAT